MSIVSALRKAVIHHLQRVTCEQRERDEEALTLTLI
jgi:hypothetical protein